MKSASPGSTLLHATWTLIAVVLPWPLLEILHSLLVGHVYMHAPLHDGTIVGGVLKTIEVVFAIYWFFLWASGRFVAILLACLGVLVFINPNIPEKSRLCTAAVGFPACCLLWYWVGVVNY